RAASAGPRASTKSSETESDGPTMRAASKQLVHKSRASDRSIAELMPTAQLRPASSTKRFSGLVDGAKTTRPVLGQPDQSKTKRAASRISGQARRARKSRSKPKR